MNGEKEVKVNGDVPVPGLFKAAKCHNPSSHLIFSVNMYTLQLVTTQKLTHRVYHIPLAPQRLVNSQVGTVITLVGVGDIGLGLQVIIGAAA